MTGDAEPDGRRRRGLRRRGLLVEAVLAVIARDGVAGVTHQAVAAEAGLPRSAVSHHFDSLDDLLVTALRSGTEQIVAEAAGADPSWLATELVGLFTANRARVAAGYELYALAARRPGLRDAVRLWLDLLADLAGRHTGDPARVRTFAVAVDGYFVQCLATGADAHVDELDALLRTALGSGYEEGGSSGRSPS
ncbi:TetR/AcrR family transcriptional regulator [Actinomycetospora termitidis]|uniref:TetR family transcriptional regulator n=1 Tax=Actinomycetospora termitidis TaxID=3053470 RepID=A0ABT7MHC2_9PSEU|nr:TetR/AcrR family transcriptional regulator [Actinomycetospora sp. Odt1-22]MDL5159836.1 TetR family transcriptional regulator [Actinomycetospora sp. Odt1-22]